MQLVVSTQIGGDADDGNMTATKVTLALVSTPVSDKASSLTGHFFIGFGTREYFCSAFNFHSIFYSVRRHSF